VSHIISIQKKLVGIIYTEIYDYWKQVLILLKYVLGAFSLKNAFHTKSIGGKYPLKFQVVNGFWITNPILIPQLEFWWSSTKRIKPYLMPDAYMQKIQFWKTGLGCYWLTTSIRISLRKQLKSFVPLGQWLTCARPSRQGF
jgi:hypothetical protein